MSQTADLEAAATATSNYPVADWGDNPDDWDELKLRQNPTGSGRLAITRKHETKDQVQLVFAGTASDLMPGDGTYLGRVDGTEKRVEFSVGITLYYVDALPKSSENKRRARIHQPGNANPGPTPWNAEECSPPCSFEDM